MDSGRVGVVVTGFGATTPLGPDAVSTWSAALAGESGVVSLSTCWACDLPSRIAAPAAGDPLAAFNRVLARKTDRCQQLAMIAAREAWQHAGAPEVIPDRLGVSVSSGIGGLISTLDAYDMLKAEGWRRISPYTNPMLMANGPAAWIGIELNARAGVHATVSACASGAEAIGYGIEMIRSGRADVVVAGGADACIHPLAIAAFAAMRALSVRNAEPQRASRPFDKGRDGFVLGEGAGMVVLESLPHAAARGAVVHAVAAGVGYSASAHHIAHAHPDGIDGARAIERALVDARVAPAQIVHVNAHASSTPAGDRAEALAIRRALGYAADQAIVSATKSMTGHLLGGAGAVEQVMTICALRDRTAPPTINLEDLDDEVAEAGIEIATEPRELRTGDGPAAALNNSYGFGGHNVSLVLVSAEGNF